MTARGSLKMLVFLLCLSSLGYGGLVELYPAPEGIPASTGYTVTIEGKTVPLWKAGKFTVAHFSYTGSVQITVSSLAKVGLQKVYPTRYEIPTTVESDNKISITLNDYSKSAVIVGYLMSTSPLLICGEEPEVSPPTAETPGVTYYGPGLHVMSDMYLDDDDIGAGDTAVYLAPGAVIRGGLALNDRSNFRVFGRGIIYSIADEFGGQKLAKVIVSGGSHISIDGIFMTGDATYHTCEVIGADTVSFTNVKIDRPNTETDAFNIFDCKDVRIDRSIMYDMHHTIVVGGTGLTDDVIITNSVLWQESKGFGLVNVAAKSDAPYGTVDIGNVIVSRCDVLSYPSALISFGGFGGYVGNIHNLLLDSVWVHKEPQDPIQLGDSRGGSTDSLHHRYVYLREVKFLGFAPFRAGDVRGDNFHLTFNNVYGGGGTTVIADSAASRISITGDSCTITFENGAPPPHWWGYPVSVGFPRAAESVPPAASAVVGRAFEGSLLDLRGREVGAASSSRAVRQILVSPAPQGGRKVLPPAR